MPGYLRSSVRRFRHARAGNVLVETALVATVLGVLAIGSIDFGLAYMRQSMIDNAVRAGMQFALARHPSMGEIVDGVVTTQNVRDAVWKATDYLTADPGDPPLSVSFSCECPDGTAVACTSTAVSTLACSDRRTYLNIRLQNDYDLLFAYPGLGRTLALVGEGAVRLN
ncbi:MAG: pilus assembly protein [Alphaproteobacteria bacterium]|nr:MAG: pilus assembly protein [Alphaproteobacteria bacterium]